MPDSAKPRPTPTSASYSITVRVYAPPDSAVVGRLATAVSEAGGLVTAVDVSESRHDRITIDVTCSAVNGEHSEQIVAALRQLDGIEVHRVSDRTFLLHLGGKISVESKVPLRTRDDLSMAYTPGVGRVSLALAERPGDVAKLTIKGNAVAVVTDGSAVLGLGNLGPGAALPVMEGKAALFKRFANIDAWPICLDTQDVDQIVATVRNIAPGFGGINLEDISAPRCFEVEARLRELLDIPVFHDDQHGTAIVVLAALTNALRCVRKGLNSVRVVVAGGGAAGTAIVDLLLAAGLRHVLVWDREGILSPTDDRLGPAKHALANKTNPAGVTGDLHDAVRGCRRVHRGIGTRRAAGRLDRRHGRGPGGVRAGQSGPGDRCGRRPAMGDDPGHRTLGLSQPDQQRAGVPGRVPRPAGRAGTPGHHRDAAPGGHGAGSVRQRQPAESRPTSSPRYSTRRCPPRWPLPWQTPPNRPSG